MDAWNGTGPIGLFIFSLSHINFKNLHHFLAPQKRLLLVKCKAHLPCEFPSMNSNDYCFEAPKLHWKVHTLRHLWILYAMISTLFTFNFVKQWNVWCNALWQSLWKYCHLKCKLFYIESWILFDTYEIPQQLS